MGLEYETKTINEIDYRDLDTFIQKEYGWKEYEFVAVEECSNDSYHSFDVDGNLDTCDLSSIDKWKNGGFVHYSNHTIMNMLCRDGHIPAGNYIVSVSW
jgi:hypothetical protein